MSHSDVVCGNVSGMDGLGRIYGGPDGMNDKIVGTRPNARDGSRRRRQIAGEGRYEYRSRSLAGKTLSIQGCPTGGDGVSTYCVMAAG
jgi:hypothetical protein